jgi:anti-sigma regulatory factor (Ser/Thr protein kinase)
MPGQMLTLRLPIRPASVPAARRGVNDVLRAWQLAHLTDNATVIASELVTNAVQHAGQGIAEFVELTLNHRDGALYVEVADSWQWEMPSPRQPTPDDESGRGLLLVDALSHSWGVRPRQVGKVVWARVAPC